MSEQPVNVGIVGASFGYSVHLPAFDALPDVRITALADDGSGRAAAASRLRAHRPRAFSSGIELAAWEGVDAVSVAVPPGRQLEGVRMALEHGKAVLCEKPFGLDAEQAAGLMQLADETSAVTALGYEFRYDLGIGEILAEIGQGRIGRVQHIKVTWLTSGGTDRARPWSWRDDHSLGGGILNEFCSHVFDYTSVMARGRISDVWCRCETRMKERIHDGRAREVEAPDTCEISCAFDGGASAQLFVSNAFPIPIGHSIDVYGDTGVLSFHHAPPFTPEALRLSFRDAEGREHAIESTEDVKNEDTRVAPFRRLAADFIRAFRGAPPARLPRFEAGVAVRRVIAACQESAGHLRSVAV